MLAVATILLLTQGDIWADPIIKQIYYQKKTTLSYPATRTFQFSLWLTEDGTDPEEMVWSEEKPIKMRNAYVKTYLGDTTLFDTAVDFSEQYWVQVDRWKQSTSTWVPVGKRDRLTVVHNSLWSEKAGTATTADSTNGLFHKRVFFGPSGVDGTVIARAFPFAEGHFDLEQTSSIGIFRLRNVISLLGSFTLSYVYYLNGVRSAGTVVADATMNIDTTGAATPRDFKLLFGRAGCCADEEQMTEVHLFYVNTWSGWVISPYSQP
jgi:hypothetical protein